MQYIYNCIYAVEHVRALHFLPHVCREPVLAMGCFWKKFDGNGDWVAPALGGRGRLRLVRSL